MAAVVASPDTFEEIVPANMGGAVSTVLSPDIQVENVEEEELENLPPGSLIEDFGRLPESVTFHSKFSGLLTGANVDMTFGEENGLILEDMFSFDVMTPQGDFGFGQPDIYNPVEGFFPFSTAINDRTGALNPANAYGVDSNGDVTGLRVKDGEVLTFNMSNPLAYQLTAQAYPFATTWGGFSFFGIPDPGVPEPSMWAMLIAGIGMVGGALRIGRRRVQAAIS